jgi:hypothetical protein
MRPFLASALACIHLDKRLLNTTDPGRLLEKAPFLLPRGRALFRGVYRLLSCKGYRIKIADIY